MIQGSEEWFQARCGKATASEFVCVLAKGQGKTRSAYLRRVVAERLTGKPVETYRNGHMGRGEEQEPFGRLDYEAHTGNMVQEVGFIDHEELAAGCSPDGLIDEDGGVEIKSVIATVQVDTILSGGYPPEHKAQVQGNLWITKRKWWDFCSYCPDMREERLRRYIHRVQRDEAYIRALEAEVRKFLSEADQLVSLLLGHGVEEQLRASVAIH